MQKTPDPITSRELFILACRVLALWELIVSAEYALTVFNIVARLARVPSGYTFASYLEQTIGTFLIGIALLVGAPALAYLFYRDSSSKGNPEDFDKPSI
jgi:hypothetical protein